MATKRKRPQLKEEKLIKLLKEVPRDAKLRVPYKFVKAIPLTAFEELLDISISIQRNDSNFQNLESERKYAEKIAKEIHETSYPRLLVLIPLIEDRDAKAAIRALRILDHPYMRVFGDRMDSIKVEPHSGMKNYNERDHDLETAIKSLHRVEELKFKHERYEAFVYLQSLEIPPNYPLNTELIIQELNDHRTADEAKRNFTYFRIALDLLKRHTWGKFKMSVNDMGSLTYFIRKMHISDIYKKTTLDEFEVIINKFIFGRARNQKTQNALEELGKSFEPYLKEFIEEANRHLISGSDRGLATSSKWLEITA